MKRFIALLVALATCGAFANESMPVGKILPEPQRISSNNISFTPSHGSTFIYFHPDGRTTYAGKAGADIYLGTLRKLAPGSDGTKFEIHAGSFAEPEIAAYFGGNPPALPAQGYAIKIVSSSPEKVVAVLGSTDARGMFYAFATLRQLIDATGEVPVQNLMDVEDFPAWRERYICDYFLNADAAGFKWAASNKISGAAMLVDANWRNPEWWKKAEPVLADMKKISKLNVIDFMIQLHIYHGTKETPKLNIADEKQIDEFIAACRKMAENGASILMIAADDTTPRDINGYHSYFDDETVKFGSVGRAHGYLMKRIYEALHPDFPNLRLSMVGAPYALSFGVGAPEIDQYLIDWSNEAPKEVFWIWTGPEVCSPKITKRDHEVVEKLLPGGQPIYLFDNSNGINLPAPRFDTEFYPGMEKDDKGIVFLLGLAYGSRPWEIPYYLGANSYLWNPVHYNAEREYNTAVEMTWGKAAIAPVNRMREAARNSYLAIRSSARDGFEPMLAEETAALEELSAVRDYDGKPLDTGIFQRNLEQSKKFAAYNPPTVTVPQISRINFDGEISPGEWKDAAELQLTDRTGKPDNAPTKAYIGYYGDKLYLAFDVPLDKPLDKQEPMAFDSPVFQNPDEIELFLQFAPAVINEKYTEEVGAYSQYVFDYAGNRYDGFAGETPTLWQGEWGVKTKVYPDHWTAEVELTPTDRDQNPTPAPGPNTKWKGNFHRVDNRSGKIQSFDRTGFALHSPGYFVNIGFGSK